MPDDVLAPVPDPTVFALPDHDAQLGDFRTTGVSLWEHEAGISTTRLQLSGWSESVTERPGCTSPGITGCSDAIGSRLSLDLSVDLGRHFEWVNAVGAGVSNRSLSADLSTSLVWWFAPNTGLAVTVGYAHAVALGTIVPGNPQEERSTLNAAAEFDAIFANETPFDLPDPGAPQGSWFGGLSLVGRE